MSSTAKKSFVRMLPGILLRTFQAFMEDKGMKLSASLAYYTVFSIGPLLLLIISLVSIFLGEAATQGRVFSELQATVGPAAAEQLQQIISNLQVSGDSRFALTVGIITLVIGATTVFADMQDSINMIWSLKAKPKRGWLKFLQTRLLSGSLILSIGFLMIVSLLVNTLVQAFVGLVDDYFDDLSRLLLRILNTVMTFLIMVLLFGIIFKFLPDARLRWRQVRTGALFTAILFTAGRYAIGLYIEHTATASTYGAAGSIVVLLIWVYYSAVILYLGAEFTQVYAETMGGEIRPAPFAVVVRQEEIEELRPVLPPRSESRHKSGDRLPGD